MSLLGKILEVKLKLEDEGRLVEKILVSDHLTAKGWLFLVEYQKQFYILLNARDMDVLLASFPSMSFPDVFEIPISEDNQKIMRVISGIFRWALPLP